MVSFSGLCVGGPLAGRRLISPRASIRAPTISDMEVYVGNDAGAPAMVKVDLVEYVHEDISIGKEGHRFGFWRPVDMTLFELLSELLRAYEEKHENAR